MEAESLLYSFVTRENVIISHSDDSELTGLISKYGRFASVCLEKFPGLPSNLNKAVYRHYGLTFNYLVEDGFTFGVFADEAAGRQIPFAFLERIKEVFNKTYGGGKASETVIPYKEFGSKLKEEMQYFLDHPEEISKLPRVEDVVVEFESDMTENVAKLESLGEVASYVFSDDDKNQLTGTTYFKNLLTGSEPPIEPVIQSNVLPRFVHFLSRHEYHELQVEAATVLSKIVAVSKYAKAVVDLDAVPLFVKLLASPYDELREQGMWALGYIVAVFPQFRQIVRQHGALEALMAEFSNERTHFLITAFWALTQFWRAIPLPPREEIQHVLSLLLLRFDAAHGKLLSYACSGLSMLLDGTNNEFQFVTETGICRRLIVLLRYKSLSLTPVLHTIEKMVDRHTQVIIDNDGLSCLFHLLTHGCEIEHERIAFRIVAGITGGNNQNHIQAVFSARLMEPVMEFLLRHSTADMKDSTFAAMMRDIALVVTNVISFGTVQHTRSLVEQGCLGHYVICLSLVTQSSLVDA